MVEFSKRDRLKLLAGAGASLLTSCGGGSGADVPAQTGTVTPPAMPLTPTQPVTSAAPAILRDVFQNNFTMGVALSSGQTDDLNSQSRRIALEQFNGVTPEFEMQPSFLAPEENA